MVDNHQVLGDRYKVSSENNIDECISINSYIMGNRFEIQIIDTGPGIHPDNLDKIFEPLYSTKGFGVGLGLPLVKQIMEQHSGGIDIKSDFGYGTNVTLWVPI